MPAPSPRTAASAVEVDARIEAKAKEWFYRFKTADIDRPQLDQNVNQELTAAMIVQESKTLSSFGSPTSFKFVRKYVIGDAIGYDFLWEFARGRIVEMIALDGNGKIAGIDFQTFVKDS